MEESLSKNELKNFSKRSQIIGGTGANPFKKDNRSLSKKFTGK